MNSKTMFGLTAIAVIFAAAVYLSPVLASPWWSEEDSEFTPPRNNGTYCWGQEAWEDGEFDPPCIDPETGEPTGVPLRDGSRWEDEDWVPRGGGRGGRGGLRRGGCWESS